VKLSAHAAAIEAGRHGNKSNAGKKQVSFKLQIYTEESRQTLVGMLREVANRLESNNPPVFLCQCETEYETYRRGSGEIRQQRPRQKKGKGVYKGCWEITLEKTVKEPWRKTA
jgi:hypothetical protein